MIISDKRIKLLINSILHFLVDGLCMVILFSQDEKLIVDFVLIYNTLAFSTQCLSGLIVDKLRSGRLSIFFSIVILSLIYLLKIKGYIAVVVVGVANSFFHVGGGYITLVQSDYKAWPLGVFVAPGCLGLILGFLYPKLGIVFSILLLLLSPFVYLYEKEDFKCLKNRDNNSLVYVLILLLVIVGRSLGGGVVSFSWQTSALLSLVMTLSVFFGKFIGGFLIDNFSIKYLSLITIISAMVFIVFFSDIMFLSLLGQFLLNLTMPLTLWLIYRLLPDMPGFSFGIAACALWPGALIGDLCACNNVVFVLCLLSGLLAIIYVEEKLHDK